MAKRAKSPEKDEQKPVTEIKRGRVENLRPWQPGQSGNPGGQPKGLADVRRLARQHTAESIEALVKWMRSDNPRASIAAAVSILNRGWGMPQQTINATITDVRALTDAELGEFLIGDADQSGSSTRAIAPPNDKGALN